MTQVPAVSGDHVRRNRAHWTSMASEYAEKAPRVWSRDEISWGMWGVPESDVQVLGDVAGLDVVELGCGTAYFSAWLARRGARPVGIDLTPAQLATARAMQERFGLRFSLIEANAEAVPLGDASFDLALSEYGASIWADPHVWVPEAARLLRPGGRLVFLCNTVMRIIAADELGYVSDRLHRDHFGLYRLEWPDDESVEFVLPHGEWIRLLRSAGFDLEDLAELRPPDDATREDEYVPLWWARRWPAEEIWVARKRGQR